MTVAFVGNYSKTVFFHAVARGLESAGHRVYWISPSRWWTRWLLRKQVPGDRILDLTAYAREWVDSRRLSAEELGELAELERLSGEPVRGVLRMDRLLARKDPERGLRYLAVVQRRVREFLTGAGVEVVFSEHSWAVELVTAQVCAGLRLANLAPEPTRVPDGRFAFFEGHRRAVLAAVREPSEADRARAEAFYRDFQERQPRPAYALLLARPPRPRLTWLPRLVENLRMAWLDPHDESRYSVAELAALNARQVLNTWLGRLVCPFAPSTALPTERPYVLFALHKQPESSIDVLGGVWSDQLEAIRALAYSLPVTHDLYVKEHSNAIGDRSVGWYRRLRSLPGVRLVDPYADSFALVRRADLVVSVSSTILYEAGLLGVPAASTAVMFFGRLLARNGGDPHRFWRETEAARSARAARAPGTEPARDDRARAVEFLAWLLAQSFEGTISDPVTDPRCMEEGNLARVASGFLCLIERRAGGSRSLRSVARPEASC